ncbi:MAG TPA: site-specific DNA-methyltransferase [Candidatus Binatia bacterium]|nr:site-specific DNA-methyltransferase [Candidatus Binatia bacterium]
MLLPGQAEAEEKGFSKYHEGDHWVLYHGDCLAAMETLEKQSVDLIFADPPYNLSNGGFTCHAGRMVPVHKGDWDKSGGQDADLKFIEAWLSRCKTILKPSGTLWVSGTQHVIFNVGYMMQRLGYHILNTVTWFKPNASPNLSCRFFTHSSELLIWAAPQRRKKLEHTFHYETMRAENSGRQMRDVWEFRDGTYIPRVFETGPPKSEEKARKKHPTQKPEALLDRIIRSSSNPDDLILDPFNGSGTTGVVASRLRRRYVGIELDEEYLKVTKERLLSVARDIELDLKPEQRGKKEAPAPLL